jgi:hypothetical protein
MVFEIMNDFRIRLSIWCLIRNGGCMLILERPYMTYVYICIYMNILNGFSIQVYSREIYSLILSQVMPWIDLPTGTPFLKFTQESVGGFYGVSS